MTENDKSSAFESLYQSYWQLHNEHLASHSPLEIAAILMTQSLTIYKTVLSEDEYHKMVDNISDMRDKIKTLNQDTNYLH